MFKTRLDRPDRPVGRVRDIDAVLPIRFLMDLNEEYLECLVNTAQEAGACVTCRKSTATVHREMCWDCMVDAYGDPYDV